MNVATNSQPGGWKSFPAELKGGRTGGSRLERTTDAFKTPGMSGLGMTAQEIAELIKTGAQTTLPLLVAQTPGTIYTQLPDGTIQVYSQPTGTTANLPGVYGSALLQGGANIQPSGSVTLPGGATAQANFGNMGEMMPLLVIGGLLAFVVFAGRK